MKSTVARRQNIGCNVRQFGHFQAGSPSIGGSVEEECRGGAMIRVLAGAIGLGGLATSAAGADPGEIGIGYLHRAGVKPALSLVEQPFENDGLAGARLAIEDNNTTGKFLNQHFTLAEFRLQDGGGAAP